MASRRKSGGSGVIAGVIAAVVAFYLWTQYRQSSHTISFGPQSDIGGGQVPTDVLTIPISSVGGFSGLDLNSGVGLGQ